MGSLITQHTNGVVPEKDTWKVIKVAGISILLQNNNSGENVAVEEANH